MKRFVWALTPPILVLWVGNFRNLFQTPKSQIQDYHAKILVELVIKKNQILRNEMNLMTLDASALSVISAVSMALGKSQQLNVLDFGGGGGHHHLVAKRVFPEINLTWQVMETQEMASQANANIKSTGLSFSSDLESIVNQHNHFELIFSNSAIQYTADPVMTLEKLLTLNYQQIFITRVPVTLGANSISYRQESFLSANGPGPAPSGFKDSRISYQNNVPLKSKVEGLLSQYLTRWDVIDEGPWDVQRFGSQVRTKTYFGHR